MTKKVNEIPSQGTPEVQHETDENRMSEYSESETEEITITK